MGGFFGFSERGTRFRTEVMAGLTTFMTMAYIIFVNPAILVTMLVVTNLREAVLGAIHLPLKFAIAVGIGLKNAGLVVPNTDRPGLRVAGVAGAVLPVKGRHHGPFGRCLYVVGKG